jgi:ABC-type antimicrobial peptide transport system permease subunit
MRIVAMQGARFLAAGFVAGVLASWGVFRLVQSQWAEMPLPNLFAWSAGGVLLFIAVGVACLLPARRATLVDPAQALRTE